MDVLILAFPHGLVPLIGISLNALSDVVNLFPCYCLVSFLVNFFDNLWVQIFFIDKVATIFFISILSPFVNLGMLLLTHFGK